jgi:transposase InsO family protein
MAQITEIPLPKKWPDHVISAVLHTISLASIVCTAVHGWAAGRTDRLVRLQTALEGTRSEIALLREELSIKDARFGRVHSHRRPYYRPIERMRILKLKAARGWSTRQVASAFLLNEQTISSWLRRIDEEGKRALIRNPVPVNKFPEFVRYIVCQLKLFFPSMGKARIARILARAGLHLGITTVGRILKSDEPPGDVVEQVEGPITTRVVTAKYPNHVYHVDLTVVPTRAGFWVPWLPFSLDQAWPFCWWAAVVVDHFSRLIVGFAIFPRRPSAGELCDFLDRVMRRVGRSPKYAITDQDKIFTSEHYKTWCQRKNIHPRFGAVGQHGSIAVVERTIRSMKDECTRRILVPLRLKAMRTELSLYVGWYNEHRPHQWLEGKTPREVYNGLIPRNGKPRYEPRPKWPLESPCAAPQTRIKGKPGGRLNLVIGYLEGRKYLPVIELRKAA